MISGLCFFAQIRRGLQYQQIPEFTDKCYVTDKWGRPPPSPAAYATDIVVIIDIKVVNKTCIFKHTHNLKF